MAPRSLISLEPIPPYGFSPRRPAQKLGPKNFYAFPSYLQDTVNSRWNIQSNQTGEFPGSKCLFSPLDFAGAIPLPPHPSSTQHRSGTSSSPLPSPSETITPPPPIYRKAGPPRVTFSEPCRCPRACPGLGTSASCRIVQARTPKSVGPAEISDASPGSGSVFKSASTSAFESASMSKPPSSLDTDINPSSSYGNKHQHQHLANGSRIPAAPSSATGPSSPISRPSPAMHKQIATSSLATAQPESLTFFESFEFAEPLEPNLNRARAPIRFANAILRSLDGVMGMFSQGGRDSNIDQSGRKEGSEEESEHGDMAREGTDPLVLDEGLNTRANGTGMGNEKGKAKMGRL